MTELIAIGCDSCRKFTQIQKRWGKREKRQESIFKLKHSRGKDKGTGTTTPLNKSQTITSCGLVAGVTVRKAKVSALFFSLYIERKTTLFLGNSHLGQLSYLRQRNMKQASKLFGLHCRALRSILDINKGVRSDKTQDVHFTPSGSRKNPQTSALLFRYFK